MSTSTNEPKPPVMGYPAPPHASDTTNAAGGGGVNGSGVATAYPYPAPPTHSVPYYYSNSNPSSYPAYSNPHPYPSYPNNNPNNFSSGNPLFLRRLIIFCVSIIVAVAAISMIVWLVLRPRYPLVSVSSASLTNLNISGSNSLSMDISLTLTVQNPNHKLGMTYSAISTDVLYSGETLAQTTLSPFYQPKQNTTQISARLVAVQEYVTNDVANGIRMDKGNINEGVRFRVRVYSWVFFNSGIWRTRRHALRVYCDNVAIGFKSSNASSGTLLGGAKQCTISI